MLGHVLVHILCLNLEKQRVHVCVEWLSTFAVLRPELVVVKIVHQMPLDVEDAHAYIHWSVKNQTAHVDLNCRLIIIEDVGSGKNRAGDKVSKLVFFACANQLYVNALVKVCHCLSKGAVIHELVQVLFEVTGCPFLELCVHPDIGIYPGALLEAGGPVNLRETHAQ